MMMNGCFSGIQERTADSLEYACVHMCEHAIMHYFTANELYQCRDITYINFVVVNSKLKKSIGFQKIRLP